MQPTETRTLTPKEAARHVARQRAPLDLDTALANPIPPGVMPGSWAECHALANKPRPRLRLANNTTLEARTIPSEPTESGTRWIRQAYAIRLHGTDVVTFMPDDSIRLDSGGWQTPTTRERIGSALRRVPLPLAMPQAHGSATCYTLGMGDGVAALGCPDGRLLAYRDGLTIEPDGTVRGHGGDAEPIRRERRRVLARERRSGAERTAWRWDGRQGGWSPHRGNAPEASETGEQDASAPRPTTPEDANTRED